MSLQLSKLETSMLHGQHGKAMQKAMQILVAVGQIYQAESLIPISSVQIAGVSYDNLGDAGLEFLQFMANEGGKVRVFATLNPAGMDIQNWQSMGINEAFAQRQMEVIEAYKKLGVITTCTCTPYLIGNLPRFNEHIAWSESSAVCFANSVLGARTNREGGPSALASALTGLTPNFGYHLDQNRLPDVQFLVDADLKGGNGTSTAYLFGALGKVIGQQIEKRGKTCVPYICEINHASLEDLKSFSASIATYGGTALFHMQGITPEANYFSPPTELITINQNEIDIAINSMRNIVLEKTDFITLGCPHLSLNEMSHLAQLLQDKHVHKEFWITTSRQVKGIADMMGITKIIEASGAKIICDTCCVVAPIKARFHNMVSDSAKACYYAQAKHHFSATLQSMEDVVQTATTDSP